MLEVLTNYICSLTMLISGFIIIKKITGEPTKLLNIKNIMILVVSIIIQNMLHDSEYKAIFTLMMYTMNIIIYKMIFKKSLSETTILTGIVMVITFLGDLTSGIILRTIFNTKTLRNQWYIMIISNIIVCIFSIVIVSIKKIKNSIYKLTIKQKAEKYSNGILFVILLIFVFMIISNNLYTESGWNMTFLVAIWVVSIFTGLFIIYTNERNSYVNLSTQYDELFDYVQSFEELIEKEQLNRHEYKNQLAVLRCLTKEKKVKDKIDEILDDSINIEGDVVRKLSSLPKGGIKGLMYYKAAIAQKSKIKLDATISLNSKSLLSKLSEKQIRVICKLIGIYFDNAIEASKETRKKNILVEVYELKDNVTFVFSNTFKKHKDFDKRNEKGISSKGEGHGNGLYFANKLLDKNDWLGSKQEIIDNYYIQQLIIKKENTSKK